jgi:two-component system NtrC family response regulator
MILLIDDERSVTASLALLLKQAGYRSESVESPEQALAVLGREACELVIQDMNFSRRTSGEEGLQLLRQIKVLRPDVPVLLITAWGSIDLAVRGMKAGAADFITKPWSNQQVLQAVRTSLGLEASRQVPADDDVPSRDELDERYDFGRLIGHSLAMRRILQLVGRVAATDASVLITGESGTGKELVAEALHLNSRRAGRPFVKVNLGGISSSLFESEMFGHVRGAFTDARADRKGRFELAHTGTIFLDEIGDLDPASQVKMLRVLQDRTFEVLGSSVRREVDVRVVSATNRPLTEMVARGEFREDLLYRINLISVHLPPLRERREDIPLLAMSMLQSVGQVYGRGTLSLTDAARRWLQAQPWPGNVRQLRQTVERAVLVSSALVLDVDDFTRSQQMDARSAAPDPLPPVGAMTMDEMERGMIAKAMRHHEGNISRVAESLGLSRAALYRRLEKYEISA